MMSGDDISLVMKIEVQMTNQKLQISKKKDIMDVIIIGAGPVDTPQGFIVQEQDTIH